MFPKDKNHMMSGDFGGHAKSKKQCLVKQTRAGLHGYCSHLIPTSWIQGLLNISKDMAQSYYTLFSLQNSTILQIS